MVQIELWKLIIASVMVISGVTIALGCLFAEADK